MSGATMGDCVDALLDTFTMDSTIAGQLAYACEKRAAVARVTDTVVDTATQWERRAAFWAAVDRKARNG